MEHLDVANDEASTSYEIDLPFHARAAGHARRTVGTVLSRWRLPQLIEVCELVVSELVTNAVTHGEPPVGLRLHRRTHDLRVDVYDARPDQPIDNATSYSLNAEREGGRGLQIVDAVTDECGVVAVPGGGKHIFGTWHI